MRGVFLSASLLLSMAADLRAATPPEVVTVIAKDARLRSGPDARFYATGYAEAGDQLEVYERKPGGWLAVRPPQGSFSWIDAGHVEKTADPEVGRIVGNQAVAWVGTELDSVNDHKWQIKLKPGEPVHILGKGSLAVFHGDEPRTFYQVAPPAGEFRWIHEHDVQTQAKLLAETRQLEASQVRSEIQLADFRIVEEQSTSPPRTDGFVARDPSGIVRGEERVASLAPGRDFRPEPAAESAFDALAKNLDLELSLMASQSPMKWRFASLRRETLNLLDRSSTTLERGKARLLLEKIEQFEQLQQGYAGFADDEVFSSHQSDAERSTSADSGQTVGFDPRFDGQGWLLPVHSTKQASPPYALLDSEGQILTFISPAPGVNLHRYLRKQVGIFGQRSQAVFLEKPHLTADRVVDLGRHQR